MALLTGTAGGSTVKASVYYGKGDIRVEGVPDPEIKHPT
jgi:Alcohol dehydrogenase GroES-associated